MPFIKLSQGQRVRLDAGDHRRLKKYNWFLVGTGRYLYAARSERIDEAKSRAVLMHREIMKTPKNLVVDHINHDTLDNRRVNLRNCTRASNSRNRILTRHGETLADALRKVRVKA